MNTKTLTCFNIFQFDGPESRVHGCFGTLHRLSWQDALCNGYFFGLFCYAKQKWYKNTCHDTRMPHCCIPCIAFPLRPDHFRPVPLHTGFLIHDSINVELWGPVPWAVNREAVRKIGNGISCCQCQHQSLSVTYPIRCQLIL